MYQQIYDPLGNAFLSTLVAALPIFTLLYFIALHPHRDAGGVRHLGISAPYAAFYGVLMAFAVACMLLVVVWTVIAALVESSFTH